MICGKNSIPHRKKVRIYNIVNSPTFISQIKLLIDELSAANKVIKVFEPQENLFDKLKKRNAFEIQKFTNLYIKVINDELNIDEWPPELCSFIKSLGDAAVYRTLHIIGIIH